MKSMQELDDLTGTPARPTSINQMRSQRAELVERMKGILAASERRNAPLTETQTAEFRDLDLQIEDLTARIQAKEQSDRTVAINAMQENAQVEGWADRAATAILNMSEHRAVVSGSIDIPQLVSPNVVADPYNPNRLIDLLVNREVLRGNAYEYLQQTVRTNNANVVADDGTKPTSVFTVASVDDRARVIAHLSEALPLRLLQDHRDLRTWLDTEMREGVLDGLETQVATGNGIGENLGGVTEVSGTTPVAFDTDRITSIRKGRTALQVLHEQPTAVAMHPADAEAIDLVREGSDGGFLSAATDLDPVFGGLQRVITTSIPEGTAVVADWSQCRLYIREGVRLDVDTSSGDLFAKNQVRMRAEMRAGFAVLRPQAFAIVALAASGGD